MLVKLADLVNTGIHCERKCEHDEPWHQLDDIRPYEDLNAKFGVQEQIEILESADREAVEEEGEGRTAQRSRDVELPRAMRVKFQNIAQHHLDVKSQSLKPLFSGRRACVTSTDWKCSSGWM